MQKYSTMDQNSIIFVAFTLRNYIKRNTNDDLAFKITDQDLDFIHLEILSNVMTNSTQEWIEELRIGEMSTI